MKERLQLVAELNDVASALHVEAEKQVRALAAENESLKKFCKNAAFDADYEAELGMERGGFTDAFNDIKTPTTDAALREIRADGAAACGVHLREWYDYQVEQRAEEFAAAIRSGEQS